jgi:hypothetical protein
MHSFFPRTVFALILAICFVACDTTDGSTEFVTTNGLAVTTDFSQQASALEIQSPIGRSYWAIDEGSVLSSERIVDGTRVLPVVRFLDGEVGIGDEVFASPGTFDVFLDGEMVGTVSFARAE